jgi:hypothetical protein
LLLPAFRLIPFSVRNVGSSDLDFMQKHEVLWAQGF